MDVNGSSRNRWWRLSAAPAIAGAALLVAGLGPATALAHPDVTVKAALTAVSCRSSDFCLAAGWSERGSQARQPLTEEWNGTRWRVLPDPLRRILTSISCGTPTFCMARSKLGLATWNGTRWTALAQLPRPGAQGPVTCGGPASCMTIVGARIKRWTGTHWLLMGGASNICSFGAPGACEWDSLSCGGLHSCLATGFLTIDQCCGDTEPWTAYWNGHGWTAVDSPPLNGNLSCTPMRFCLEVSASSAMPAQAATWTQGKGWRDVSPDLSTLCHGIAKCQWPEAPSCGSPLTCALFVTSSVPVIWSDSTWAAEPFAPVAHASPRMQAVSCGSSGNCMAVGDETTSSGGQAPAAQHWNGSAWVITSKPPA
jgi:hypothetical protein